MTLKDIAAEAEVSVATVSKAFKNADDVGEETKERIYAIAKKHGCFHKYYKERYEKKVVAVICHELNSAFYSTQLEYIKAYFGRRNTDVIISTDDFDRNKQKELIQFHSALTKVDGIIAYGLYQPVPKGIEVPVVAISGNRELSHTDIVRPNHRKAMCSAISHLKGLGHRKIAFIGETLTAKYQRSFAYAMEHYDLPNDLQIIAKSRFEQAGLDGVEALLKKGEPFTAIICAYDYIAIGAIKALQNHGLHVPGDVSVIGSDNIPTAGHLNKALTTIDQASPAICDIACSLLSKKMQNKYYCAGSNIEIDGTLIVRETTGPCPEN